MRVTLPIGISLDLVDGWLDITDDLPAGSPFTLARADGIGAFQVSVATYSRGAVPNAGLEQVRGMLLAFGRARQLGEPVDIRAYEDRVVSVGGSFEAADFIRAWYASDGRNFIFASHTSSQRAPAEIEVCDSMIRSVSFKNAEPGARANATVCHDPC